ncbi:MAG TPA: alkene reductase [Bryobacteraceae bacterium]|nr:alkene reductase [Bryobacteraceae bacterium]HZW94705.1 alkene reductase [Candidatus Eremiobacteraceae bacterium]
MTRTGSNNSSKALLAPYTLGDLKLKNRIVMAPLTRTRAENEGKVPNELMAEYYAQRAGAGLIITEGTFVSEQGQGWYGAPGVYSEEQRAGWKCVTDAVHGAGGLIFVQLWHQGSVSHRSLYADGRLPLGPSAVNPEQLIHVKGGRIMSETPREMALHEIKQAVKDFRHASQVARDAGFDGVQIQGGYVYLFQQFLHEVTNRRTDQYGGLVENRARILFEALEAVLEVWPSGRVGVKAGPMMSEIGAFRATDETLRTSEYVYRKIAAYKLSHVLLMRQMADLTGSPIEHMSGDAVVHHFRRLYTGTLILNAGINAIHGARLIAEEAGDLVAFGREHIANPDLAERIRLDAPLNEPRPEYFYGSSATGYTDYPALTQSELVQEKSHAE